MVGIGLTDRNKIANALVWKTEFQKPCTMYFSVKIVFSSSNQLYNWYYNEAIQSVRLPVDNINNFDKPSEKLLWGFGALDISNVARWVTIWGTRSQYIY